MNLKTAISSIRAEVRNDTLIVWSEDVLTVLSSAILNGGLTKANGIINVQVSEDCGLDKNDEHWNAEKFMDRKRVQLKLLNGNVVGLMTAARMQNVAVSSKKSGGISLSVFATAGTSIAVTAGDSTASKLSLPEPRKCGTINIIVVIDGNLTEGCMVDGIKTATEAKTVALRELDVRSRFSGDVATGTMTDSIAIAFTGKGEAIKYAGTRTVLGELIGKAVKESVAAAILKQEKLVPQRSLLKRLEERGISFENILSLAGSEGAFENPEKYQKLEKQMQLALSDRNIASLVLGSLRFDDDLRIGLIPMNQKGDYVGKAFIGEVFQSALKNYSLPENKHYSKQSGLEKNKTTVGELGPFTKSVLLALLEKTG